MAHNPSHPGLLKRNVLIQKDESGFGLTVSGDNPVYVQSVKPGGAAAKAGVEVGEKIIKVNGTLVTESNHVEVVTLIKSGSYVSLTLLGKDSKPQQGHPRTRTFPFSQSEPVLQPSTPPQPVSIKDTPDIDKSDHVKDLERTLNQEREFYKTILEKYNCEPSPIRQVQLAESKTRISALEKQLQLERARLQNYNPQSDISSLSSRNSASHSESNISLSTNTCIEKVDKVEEMAQHHTKHSILGSNSTPNIGTSIMNSNNRSKIDTVVFEGHSVVAALAEETSDNGIDSMRSMFEINGQILSESVCNNSNDIYSMEDSEFSDEEPLGEHGPFESLELLKDKKAHLAVFLHYLISNSDPIPLFFWVVTDIYANEQKSDNVKEWKKCAYEIHSTFLAHGAPLKVNIDGHVEKTMESIEEVLNDPNATEFRLRTVFGKARMSLRQDLEQMLNEFRGTRIIGLGGMFGDRQLEDDMDRAAELKIVETTLMPHLDTLMAMHESFSDTQNDKNFAMACAIATLMKSAGLSGKLSSGKGTSLERCRSFAEKEKSSFMNINKYKNKYKIQHHRGHQFQSVQYSSITLCNVCNGLLWGIGIQGLQCQACEFNVHRRNCIDSIKEMCSVSKKPGRPLRPGGRPPTQTIKPPDPIEQGRGRSESEYGPDLVEPAPAPDSGSDRGTPTPSEEGPTSPQQKNKSMGHVKRRRPKTTVVNGGSKTPESGNPPSPYPRESQSPQPESDDDDFSDSDFDVEHEVPPWSKSVDKNIIKKLKSKDIKRQEVIHELLHTEKTHVRNLKVLDKIFYRRIKKSNTLQPEEINKIFPNLEDLIKIHESLLDQMKEREQANEVIDNIGDVMLNAFGNECKECVKETFAKFCRQQKSALLEWRSYRETRKEFAAIMTKLEALPHCRRLQFAAILASTHQRLVKYPLLLESLNRTTAVTHSDYKNVEKATECCKEILNYVNDEIKRCEDELRLVELAKKIEDRRTVRDEDDGNVEETAGNDGPPIGGKFNILNHKLVMEGDLVWKNVNKKIDLHVILLNDTLVLLTKQDDRYILKKYNSTSTDNKGQSPLIQMGKALIREVAIDKKAFYLVTTNPKQPHIYELIAQTHLEKKMWVDCINQVIEVNKGDEVSLSSSLTGRYHGRQVSTSAATSPTASPMPTEEKEADEEQKVCGDSEISEGQLSGNEERQRRKESDFGNSDESGKDEKSPTKLSKEKLEELNNQLSENESELRKLIIKRSIILSGLHGEKYNMYNMESLNAELPNLVLSAIEQANDLQEIYGQLSESVSEEQKDDAVHSMNGLQGYLKEILNVICATNRHDSCADSYDGERDADKDSKRTSSKTYSSDMTDSLPRHSPLGDAILSTSPPPILISHISQEPDNSPEEYVENDNCSPVISGAKDMVEPLSPHTTSLNHEPGVLVTSPFKIQGVRKRQSDQADSKTSSFAAQRHSDSSDSG